MKKFEFSKSTAELNIAGFNFTIELGDNTLVAKSKAIREKALLYSEKMATLDEDKEDEVNSVVDEVVKFIAEAVDILLGNGAYEDIFKGRGKNMFEHIDLLNFLLDTLTEEVETYKSKYVNKYSVDRINGESKKGKK